MKKLITQNQNKLELEAIEWQVRLTSGEASPDDPSKFAQWRSRSPAHDAAYQKIAKLWGGVANPGLTWPTLDSPDQLDGQHTGKIKVIANSGQTPKSWLKGLSVAACVLILLIGSQFTDYLAYPFADYRTHIGRQTTVTLTDGSILHLNTDTAINTVFTASARKVELLKGEVEFEVAHDASRPFVVTSGAINTQAIGTKFIVRYGNGQGMVTLLRGKVRSSVTSDQIDRNPNISLSPGEQVAFNNGNFADKARTEISKADTWKNGRLELNFIPLGQAINEINRYRRGTITLLSTELAQRKINAVIDLKHIDAWLNALETTLPLQVDRFGPIVLIRP